MSQQDQRDIYVEAIQRYIGATEPMYSLNGFINSDFFTEDLLEEDSAADLKSNWVRRWNNAVELEEIEEKDITNDVLKWKVLESKCSNYFKKAKMNKKKRKAPLDLTHISEHNEFTHGEEGKIRVTGVSVSDLFEEERKMAIAKLRIGTQKLTDFEFLSLHHIIQLPMEKQSSFSLKIGPAATEFVNSLAKNEGIEEKFVHVSDEVWLACRQIQIALRKNSKQEVKKLMNQVKAQAIDSQDKDFEPVLNIYEKLIAKIDTWQNTPPSEESYIKQSIECFAEEVFCNDERLTHDWQTGTLVEEVSVLKIGKKDDDESGDSPTSSNSSGKKPDKLQPDFVASFKVDNKAKYNLIVVEVKKPGHRNYQSVPDKDKVPVEMKQCLNVIIGDGIPQPRVAGIVIDGHDVVTSYGELNYESLYQDNLVGECTILKNKSVIETVPSTYEHFKHLKRIMDGTITNITNKLLARPSTSPSTTTIEDSDNTAAPSRTVPVTYRRPSYPIPGKSASSTATNTNSNEDPLESTATATATSSTNRAD